jgi:hypothetical protein
VRALFAYWGRGYLVESWWISRLGSGDRAIRVQAAGELAERKCLRAVPRIVDAIAEDPQEGITTRAVNFNRAHDGPDASVHIDEASTVCCLLRDMGEAALPALKLSLEEHRSDPRMRRILERLLDRSRPLRGQEGLWK